MQVDISCPRCGNIIQLPKGPLNKYNYDFYKISFSYRVNAQVLAGYVPVAAGYVPVAAGCDSPPIGYLNRISYSIIRCIMHCILLWAAHDGKVQNVVSYC